MTFSSPDVRAAVVTATATSTLMIGYQMAAKATRDALFLSTFDVSALPAMVIVSAGVSVVLAFAAARVMTSVGPARLIPTVFAASAMLLLAEWALFTSFPRLVAVLVYLHYGGLGALLVSGFWSIVNERFDPRTAKKQIGKIATGATVGGLLGGVLAERVAAILSVGAMLPILALFHLTCAGLVYRLRSEESSHPSRARSSRERSGRESSGVRILAETPYLRNIAALVVLTTVSEMLIDYVFKARASAAFGSGEELLRLFGVFYSGIALLTVAVQATASKFTLQKLGPGRTAATLPSALVLGGAGALVAPGLTSVAIARGSEAVLRNSLYRPGYELLFTPLPRRDKRATKTLVDVGVVRFGDIIGGAVVQGLILVAAGAALTILLGVAIALSLVGVVVAFGLHRGYAQTLESSLLRRASQLELPDLDAVTGTAMLQTMGTMDLVALREHALPDATAGDELDHVVPERAEAEVAESLAAEPEMRQMLELRSRDPTRLRAALDAQPLTPGLVAHAVPLLGWDALAPDVIRALRAAARRVQGQLVDRLLDSEEEFAVRRRIPLVLAACPTQRVVDGLFKGLEDKRFEVRYRCGRALSRVLDTEPDLEIERARAIEVVLREVAVDRRVWESRRLLDQMEDEEWSPVVDEVLRDRASRSLEHVFTVLALFLAREPLKVAFHGLYTDDTYLRGTALEYLETVLPARVREQLWAFLEVDRKRQATTRTSDQVLAELLESNRSIAINLEELRRKSRG